MRPPTPPFHMAGRLSIIIAVLMDILFGTAFYWLAYVYINIALAFFLVCAARRGTAERETAPGRIADLGGEAQRVL